jgi:predicted DNA-binding WGR domain protein
VSDRYQHEQACLWWEIERVGTAVITRYGRSGGAFEQSRFDHPSEAAAQADVLRRVGDKLKRGYQRVAEPAPEPPRPLVPGVRVVAAAEARKLGLDRAIVLDAKGRVAVLPGGAHLDSLPLDFRELDAALGLAIDEGPVAGLIVTGALTIGAALVNGEGESGPFLWVAGALRAADVAAGGSQIVVEGEVHIPGTFFGHFNDGMTLVRGLARCGLVVSEQHAMTFAGGLVADVVIGGPSLCVRDAASLRAGVIARSVSDLEDRDLAVSVQTREAFDRLVDEVVDREEPSRVAIDSAALLGAIVAGRPVLKSV